MQPSQQCQRQTLGLLCSEYTGVSQKAAASASLGTIGELLQLKPIITVNKEGIYTTFAKVRGKKQALDRLVGIAKEHISKAASQIAVCYGGAQEEAAYIIKQIGQLANVKELITSSVSPVIGVHTGPGTVGFAVLESN